MPQGAPYRPLPLGFFLAGMLSLFFTAGVVLMLIATELDAPPGAASLVVRGLCVVLASLGAIATEALWDARPSAYPASLALAATWLVTIVSWMLLSPADKLVIAVIGALSACVVGPILVYLRRRTRAMWPARPRVLVPQP